MNGYSSYDSYFGVDNARNGMYAPYIGAGGVTPYKSPFMPKLPGINAPKEEKHQTGKIVASLAGAVVGAILLVRALKKGKVGEVAEKSGGIGSVIGGAFAKLKGLFTKSKVGEEITEDVVKKDTPEELAAARAKLVDVLKKAATKKEGEAAAAGGDIKAARADFLSVLGQLAEKVTKKAGPDVEKTVGEVLR